MRFVAAIPLVTLLGCGAIDGPTTSSPGAAGEPPAASAPPTTTGSPPPSPPVPQSCTQDTAGTFARTGAAAPTPATNVPVVLADNQIKPWTVAIDAANIYWANYASAGGIYKVAKSGGTPTPLYEGDLDPVESLALDETSIYFPTKGAIVAVPLEGGAPRTLSATSGPSSVRAVAVANGEVYWVEASSPSSASAGMRKVAAAGGTAATIPLPNKSYIGGALTVTATADAIYASMAIGGIVRVPLDGATSTFLNGATVVRTLGFDKCNVYFGGKDAVHVVPKAGGTATSVVAAESAYGVVLDGSYLYLSENTPTGRILKVARADGAVSILAENQGAPHAVAVDDTSVYWSCGNEDTIKKVAK